MPKLHARKGSKEPGSHHGFSRMDTGSARMQMPARATSAISGHRNSAWLGRWVARRGCRANLAILNLFFFSARADDIDEVASRQAAATAVSRLRDFSISSSSSV